MQIIHSIQYFRLSFHIVHLLSSDALPVARTLMVDMESKVIDQMSSHAQCSGSWKYCKDQEITQKQGSGNNWAHGYCTHGTNTRDSILNGIRREVEK